MATKTVVTRIKNKVDTLAKWNAYTGTLLNGEIAVVRVPTDDTYTNPVTGASEPVVELLMKVGDGSTSFANLPWMSAKASDVYDWAKAKTVEFDTSDYKVKFKTADGTVLLNVDLTNIDSRLDALESKKITVTPATATTNGVVQAVTQGDASHEIDVTYGLIKTADIDSKQVTAAKIADSTITATQLASSAVSTAKIADGAVTNAKLGTDISSDKINVGTSSTAGTLSAKLAAMSTDIAANTSKLTGHTDDAINTLIDNKINALDVSEPSASGTSTSFIATAKQTDGKIVVTKANLPTAGTSAAGITKLYTSVGTSTDGTVTRKVVYDINTQVQANKTDIDNLKTAVAGGVHFRGTVDAEPGATTTTVGSVLIAAGDVVIYNGKEYICTAVTDSVPSWEQLGDVTRIGNLETKINNLDVTTGNDVASTHKFVSQVKQTDGKIAVTYTQPSASDILYDSDSNVNTKLGTIDTEIAKKANSADVYTKTETDTQITNAINALDVSAPSATDNTNNPIAFIDSVSQTNGKISATKKAIRAATTSVSGIVKLNDAVTSTSTAEAATANAVKTAYDKAAAAATDAASRAPGDHGHGNITNTGTITATAVTAASGVVVVDSSNKVQKVTNMSTFRSIIGAGTSSLTLGTTATTAAKGNHTHSAYETRMGDSETRLGVLEGNYVKYDTTTQTLRVGLNGTDEIIFDCGGAE